MLALLSREGGGGLLFTLAADRLVLLNATWNSSAVGRWLLQTRGVCMAVTSSWPKSTTRFFHSRDCGKGGRRAVSGGGGFAEARGLQQVPTSAMLVLSMDFHCVQTWQRKG